MEHCRQRREDEMRRVRDESLGGPAKEELRESWLLELKSGKLSSLCFGAVPALRHPSSPPTSCSRAVDANSLASWCHRLCSAAKLLTRVHDCLGTFQWVSDHLGTTRNYMHDFVSVCTSFLPTLGGLPTLERIRTL